MNRRITLRQLTVICFVALFSPLVQVSPGELCKPAGGAAWVTPLVAIPLLVISVIILRHAFQRIPGGGLSELLCRGYGGVLGRIFCAVDGVWLFMMFSVSLRMNAERFVSSTLRDAAPMFFLLTTLVLILWQSGRTLPAFARVAQMFFFPLTIAAAVVVVLGAGDMQPENWLPVWTDDAAGIGKSLLPLLGVTALGAAAYFLYGEVEEKSIHHQGEWWTVGFGLTAAACAAVVLGNFGCGLSQRLQVPFFALAKEVKLGNTVLRMEAVVVTLWILSDLVLGILLIHCTQRAIQGCAQVKGHEAQVLYAPLIFAAFPAAMLWPENVWRVEEEMRQWLAPAGVILLYGVTLVGAGLVFLRTKKHGGKKRKIVDKPTTLWYSIKVPHRGTLQMKKNLKDSERRAERDSEK